MVVESTFIVVGGDETGFGCGFHVLHVESHGLGKKTVEKDWLVGSTILEKGGLKSWDIWLGFVNKQKFWSFWVIVGFELWVMDFEFKLWVMKTELSLNQRGPKPLAD